MENLNELLPINEKNGKRAINARALHAFLGSKQDFSTWIKARIKQYDFVENQDYVAAPQNYGTANGGYSTRLEYALSINMAKELSMVEGNEKGKQARKYFIACEEMATGQKELSEPKQPKPVSARTLQLMKLDTAKWLMKNLNYSDTSKLALAKVIADPLELPVPVYAKSKGVIHSATDKLKERGISLSARKFNKMMIEAGMMELASRHSRSKGKDITWPVLIGDGLLYGENGVHPNNPRQTQPSYYDHNFDELLSILGIVE